MTVAYLALTYFGGIVTMTAAYLFGLPRLSVFAFGAFALVIPAIVAAFGYPELASGLFIGGATGGLLRYVLNPT